MIIKLFFWLLCRFWGISSRNEKPNPKELFPILYQEWIHHIYRGIMHHVRQIDDSLLLLHKIMRKRHRRWFLWVPRILIFLLSHYRLLIVRRLNRLWWVRPLVLGWISVICWLSRWGRGLRVLRLLVYWATHSCKIIICFKYLIRGI